ncbi:MAG: hypothetical protein ACSHYB_08770 [Roseibacillus sp.]
MKFFFFLWFAGFVAASESAPWDLTTPPMMEDAPPSAGKRVRQIAPEYQGTQVHHSLYLPNNWTPDGNFPVIVEYTGNKWAPSQSSGQVNGANLGYGLSGSRDFIWVVFPYISENKKQNEVTWWGDRQATIDYAKLNLPRICKEFGGDPKNIILCGFSRGAIATSYLGLADDDIASLWRGIMTHDHFDGAKEWHYPKSDRKSALTRLARLQGRPVLVCGTKATRTKDEFLGQHLDLADFTFLDVPTTQLFTIPEKAVIHPHTDLWMHKPSPYRTQARAWLKKLTQSNP